MPPVLVDEELRRLLEGGLPRTSGSQWRYEKTLWFDCRSVRRGWGATPPLRWRRICCATRMPTWRPSAASCAKAAGG